eukprot:1407729-Pyramimonas_sp.AAC.1
MPTLSASDWSSAVRPFFALPPASEWSVVRIYTCRYRSGCRCQHRTLRHYLMDATLSLRRTQRAASGYFKLN